MASLPPLTGYNLGGIDQFWFIPVNYVQSIPDEESNVIEQDIQLVGDAKFSVGYATQETLQFTENQNRDAQGNFYEQSLSGFYPKDQENVASLFEGMAAERFIVIFRDNNGYYKLLGSLANPCKFTATFESGDSANGRNGYSFEFTRTDVEKAPFYRGVINESEKVINTDPCAGLVKPLLEVDFNVDLNTPDQYDEIQFTDNTTNAAEWYWDFGDGVTSTQQNPTHVYGGTSGTTYTVTLIVKDGNDKVGIAVKQDLITIQNNQAIADQLSNNLLTFISINNKVYGSQTKAIQVVEHDTGSYNTLEVGYNGYEVDKTAIQNWLSNNGYSAAYLKRIYDFDDTILAEETKAANRFELKSLGSSEAYADANVADDLKYKLQRTISFEDSWYFAFLCTKNNSGGRSTWMQSNTSNNFDALFRNVFGVQVRPDNGKIKGLSGLPIGQRTLAELEYDHQARTFKAWYNGYLLGDYIGGKILTDYTTTDIIEGLAWRGGPTNFYEMAFSNSLENKEKVRAYIENEYNINIRYYR